MKTHLEYVESQISFIRSIIETIKYDAQAIANTLHGDTTSHDLQKLKQITQNKQNLFDIINQIYEDGYRDGKNHPDEPFDI
jgi:hypothetical protein